MSDVRGHTRPSRTPSSRPPHLRVVQRAERRRVAEGMGVAWLAYFLCTVALVVLAFGLGFFGGL